jgi:methyl-accepting chemotaxis protein
MNRWISKYLSILTLVPVALLILFMLVDLQRSYHQFDEASKTTLDAKLVGMTSDLVHEMQKERGMSAGFIGSKGVTFLRELPSQRQTTDASQAAFLKHIADQDYSAVITREMAKLKQRLSQLRGIRSSVDKLTIPLADALSYYSDNNAIILDLNGTLATELEETVSSEKFLTLYNVAYAKEQAGIERAVLSNVFGRGSFTPDLFTRFIALLTKQDTYLKSALAVSDDEYKNILQSFLNSAESKTVTQFRDIASHSEDGFDVTPEQWFSAATARINKLKVTEQTLLEQILSYSEEKAASAKYVLIFEIILLLGILGIAYNVFSTIQLRAAQSAEINRVMLAVNKDNDLTETAKIISEDDLGKIAELLNLTFAHIREDFMSFQLHAAEISAASVQSSAAVEQSRSNLTRLQLDITGIASATEEMTASIQEVMQNMKVAASGAEKASKVTIKGEQAVVNAVQGISQTAAEVKVVGETIEDLNAKVSDILGMVDVIKSVADQTNLLALNAAIEAARAGEQGRGFAVVADEVRSLAKRTQQSTQEISNVVDVLRESSQKAFSSIATGNEQATLAVSQAQDITNVLAEVVKNIGSVDDVTQVVSQSTSEQSTVIQSINSNVSNIDSQARENVIGAEQLAASSMQLAGIVKDMQTRLSVYKV